MEFACPTCREPNATYFPDVPCTSWKRGFEGIRIWCCEICKSLDELALASCFDDNKVHKVLKDSLHHFRVYHKRENLKSHKGNGTYKGAFAFTLTKSPSDDLTVDEMITAARKLMAQKSCPVKKYAWVLEYKDYDQKTHPHIHGMYETETGGRIERKHFKRAWPIWDETVRQGAGFRGGYHRPVNSDDDYSHYMAKDFYEDGRVADSSLE